LRTELCAHLRQAVQQFSPLWRLVSDEVAKRIGLLLGNDIILNELTSDFAARNDMDETDLRHLYEALRECERDAPSTISDDEWTVGDRGFERGSAALAERCVRCPEHAE